MATGDPPQHNWSTTNSSFYLTNPPNYNQYSTVGVPADLTWNSNKYRNEAKLNNLTKTMGSIIALTEWLEDPKEPMTDEQKKALLEHLNNLLLHTTKDFMEESQKPKANPAFQPIYTHTYGNMLTSSASNITLTSSIRGTDVQTPKIKCETKQVEDRKEE